MAPSATQPSADRAIHAAILDAVSTHGLVLLHQDGTILHANGPAQRAGLNKGDPIADGLAQMQLAALDNKAPLDIPLWLSTDPAPPLRGIWLQPDGTEQVMELTRAHVEDQMQILTLTDRSVEWRLRAALTHADSGDDANYHLRSLAHDLTNAFGIVQIAADSLGRLTIPNPAERHLASVLEACKRGDKLIQSILEEPRAAMIIPSQVDVSTSLVHVAQLAKRVTPPTTKFVQDIAPGPIMVGCRRADLDAAIMHLLANARKAIARAGTDEGILRVALSTTQTEVQILVEDNGAGLSDTLINRAPDPYLSRFNAVGGSGAGLAIVETFAWRVGGTFRLENRAKQGCRVTLTLPRAEAIADADQPSESNPKLLSDLSGYRILLVEADDPFRFILSEALRNAGARIAEASTGAEARRILSHKKPDIVISSHLLPDGMTAADLRAAAPGIALLSLVAPGDPIDPETPHMMLRKPIRLDELENAIHLVAPRPNGPD